MIIQRLSGAGEIVAVSPETDSKEIETTNNIMLVLSSRENEEQYARPLLLPHHRSYAISRS